MKYRGLFYFFALAVFFYSLFFARIFSFQNPQESKILADEIFKNPKEDPDASRLVETFVELEKPKETRNLSNLNSTRQGKLTEEKGYSYYSDIRYLSEAPASGQNPAQNQTGTPRDEEKNPAHTGTQAQKDPGKTEAQVTLKNPLRKTDLLPNLYEQERVTVNLSSDGFIGIDAEKSEYAQYLMDLAKKIFYNWADFIPAMQIERNLIKTNASGRIEGALALYFDDDHSRYSVAFLGPFASETMNELTRRSFLYLKLPPAPEKIKMNTVLVRFSIQPLTQKATGEFKFDFFKEKKKEDQDSK